jgi:hypothetical protein
MTIKTAALVLALAHTTRPGTTDATVTKITKATVFVQLENGSAERFNRATGKRVGGNYREGDLIITPTDLQRLTDAEAVESTAPATPELPAAPAAPARRVNALHLQQLLAVCHGKQVADTAKERAASFDGIVCNGF